MFCLLAAAAYVIAPIDVTMTPAQLVEIHLRSQARTTALLKECDDILEAGERQRASFAEQRRVTEAKLEQLKRDMADLKRNFAEHKARQAAKGVE